MKVFLGRRLVFAATALVAFASLTAASSRRPLSAEALVGQYQMGGAGSDGPVIELTLFQNSKFSMITNLGHKVRVKGNWRLDARHIILCLNRDYVAVKNASVFGWLLQPRSRGASFDLVPNETIDAYQKDPSNIAACYR